MSATLVIGGDAARREGLRRITGQPKVILGVTIVGAIVLAALLAPLIATHDPYKANFVATYTPPNSQYWFGTDELGRDIFSRVLYGARLSLVEGVVSVAIAILIGVPVGLVSGYLGGIADAVAMRCIDVLLAFPGVLLAIAIVSVLGPSLQNAVIAVGIYAVPIFARLTRSSTMSVKEEPYIEACRAAGLGHARILVRHILPNIAATLLVMATLRVAVAILTASSLGFLGLGAQPPAAEWGTMLANGRNALIVAPYVALFPGGAIILLVMGLNLMHEGLRRVLDPRLRER